MRFLLCAIATLSLSGCDLIRDPVIVTDAEGALMVHAMLRSKGDTAMVLITRADTEAQLGNWPASIPVRGAAVDLVQGADTLRLPAQQAEDDACWYEDFQPVMDITGACYVAHVPSGIDSGEEFVLLVATPEGERVEGRVTVPPAPIMLTPEPGTSIPTSAIPAGNVLVRWENPAGNELHLGFETDAQCISGVGEPGSFGFQAAMPVSGRDSMTVQLAANCAKEWTELAGRITLAAYDPGYGNYLRDAVGTDWTTPERAAVNLQGALGVFAAVASHEVPVVLERGTAMGELVNW